MCCVVDKNYSHYLYLDTWILGYLDTWSAFEAAKTAPWPSRLLHNFSKLLDPSDELAGRGCG